ncbi:MAG: hypothetical protein HY897_20520 [Deltaproteobacteria bacterium]|nr:hypothetical protein [Deltaproteobacteria bacterium]
MRFPPAVSLVPALAAAAALASCSVDYAGILGGKTCDQSGACSEGYVCDRQTWSCVETGGAAGSDTGGRPDANRPDGGTHDAAHGAETPETDDGGPVTDAGAEAATDAAADVSHLSDSSDPLDAGVDAGPDATATDSGPSDTGEVDAGADDVGALDSGADDAGAGDTGPADAGFIDAGIMVCAPNDLKCASEKDLNICKSDGSGWEWSQTCPGYCLTDHCVACKPGTFRCSGDHDLEICAGDGTAWAWIDWCGDFCLVDHCAECRPGDKWCDWDDLVTCGPDGESVSKTTCEFGCNDTALECNVCDPGSAWCEGNTLNTCHGDGAGFDQRDCCVPSSCRNGDCVDNSPWIANAAPLSANVYTDVTITIDGCQFAGNAVVEFWFGSSWGGASNGSITARTGSTQIKYKLSNIQPPKGKDYPMRVHNPGGGNSNQVTFHVNN